MAISKVRVQINGTWTNLTENSSTGKWEGSITAPATTSYNLSNKYYPVTVEATNEAGTVTTKTSSDATLGETLRLVVKETIKPVITLVEPTNGAYSHNSTQPISFTVKDEVGGSGVDCPSISLKIDGVEAKLLDYDDFDGTTWSISHTPTEALSNGEHTIEINASDNDGNSAITVVSTFTIDTIRPSLNISSPANGFKTNVSSVTLSGTTSDNLQGAVSVTATRNDDYTVELSLDSYGAFSKSIPLVEGENKIKVVAVDKSGLSTIAYVTVTLDTTVPNISNVSLTPSLASTSETVKIVVEVV